MTRAQSQNHALLNTRASIVAPRWTTETVITPLMTGFLGVNITENLGALPERFSLKLKKF